MKIAHRLGKMLYASVVHPLVRRDVPAIQELQLSPVLPVRALGSVPPGDPATVLELVERVLVGSRAIDLGLDFGDALPLRREPPRALHALPALVVVKLDVLDRLPQQRLMRALPARHVGVDPRPAARGADPAGGIAVDVPRVRTGVDGAVPERTAVRRAGPARRARGRRSLV